MASKHGYYSVEEYTKQKQHQETWSRIPPRANVLAAANHVREIFESKKFLYGVFGGLAMLSLGYHREQPDLHFAYDDKDFPRIKAKLEGDKRIRLPDGMNSLFPAKILIRTGPSYKDEGCAHAAEIALDLVPPGSNGTPTAGMLSTNLVLLTLRSEKGKPITYKGLNLPHLIRTSVYYSGITGLSWDPRKDILFLCQTYGGELAAVRNRFDQRAAQQNFLGTPFFSRLSPQEQRVCYHVLLGKEPPPTMNITPPTGPNVHKHSASASSVDPRPRLASHKSTPTLQSGNQAGLLSPPLPIKNPHKRSASAEVRPTELPASTEIHHQGGLQDHNRDSRSRYRPISAPTSREGSPREGQLGLKPGQPMPQMQQHIPHNHAHHRMSFLPQPPMSMGPTPVGPNTRRSMQNLNSSFHGPVPAFAFAQTPMLNGINHYQQPTQAGIAEMSATPVPVNPGQHHLKSQAGLAGAMAPRPHAQGPINERLPPHQTRASYHAPPAFVAEFSSTPAPGARTSDHKVNSISELPATSPAPKSQDSPRHADAVELSAVEYPMPPKPRLETSSAPLAVELDAVSPIGHLIAELSVDRTTPAPNHVPKTQQTPHDSPISPPVNHIMPAAITHTDIPIRPLNPRTHSAPLTALPSSLMAGGPKAHTHVPSETAPLPLADMAITGTNASRYTQLSQPSSLPSQPSPYQAYHPPAQATPSAHADTQSPETNARPLSFAALRDVDGASHYFKSHRRDASHGSRASSASCDSRELAAEYRAAMPEFGGGYVGEKEGGR